MSAARCMYWLLGGLEGRTWDHLLLGGAGHSRSASAVTAAHARDLDALLLGEVAPSRSASTCPRVRLRLVLATSLVVGAAVAVAGPIGFVGLLVPHMLRLAVGAAARVRWCRCRSSAAACSWWWPTSSRGR